MLFGVERQIMLDVVFVAILLGGFGLCLAYTAACERL
jgi:hypothetical protein